MTEPVVLDACVLYRPSLRRMLLAVAGHGAFRPIWSERLWAEWFQARLRAGDDPQALAQDRASTCQQHPAAMTQANPAAIDRVMALCDRNGQRSDAHVIATAIGAGRILTFNLSDFPQRLVRPFGIQIETPVAFAARLARDNPAPWHEAADAWHGGPTEFLRHLAEDLRLRRCARILGS